MDRQKEIENTLRRSILEAVLTMDECDLSRISCMEVFDEARNVLKKGYGPVFEDDLKNFDFEDEPSEIELKYQRLRGQISAVLSILGQEVGSYTDAKHLIAATALGLSEALGEPITAAERIARR